MSSCCQLDVGEQRDQESQHENEHDHEQEIHVTVKTPSLRTLPSPSAVHEYNQDKDTPKPKRERTSSSCVGGYWEPDAAEIHALTMNDFDVIGVLGVGTYGVVKLARHIPSGASVALKVLSKEQVVSMRQEKHILRERSVHITLRHPFIARLFGTFQDDDCIYLVIEYLPGGELWSVLYGDDQFDANDEDGASSSDEDGATSPSAMVPNSPATLSGSPPTLTSIIPLSRGISSPSAMKLNARSRGRLRNKYGGLKEEYAAFYLGCILCALEYLHHQDMLYRDLKLENLVLDRRGYPKVLDFGFAKPNAGKIKNMTLCGSMDYMAPEIVLHEPHDQRADIWSFGIIMYELLLGKTPFYHDNPRELGRKITSDPVTFPNDFEEEFPRACDLIQRLLVKTPEDRVRSMDEIQQHPFFTHIFPDDAMWQRLLRKELPSPFKPILSGPFDTSFFQKIPKWEQDELNEGLGQPYIEDGSDIFREF